MYHRNPVAVPRATSADGAELKSRIFAAFEHACRFGDVEVADQLLAIINSRWMRQARGQPPDLRSAPRAGAAGSPVVPLS